MPNPNCNVQNCSTNCCDQYGSCPATTSGCQFYYDQGGLANILTTPVIVGIILAFFIVTAIIAALICNRIKKRITAQALIQATNNSKANSHAGTVQGSVVSRVPARPNMTTMPIPLIMVPPMYTSQSSSAYEKSTQFQNDNPLLEAQQQPYRSMEPFEQYNSVML